jgi:uroporphyrin-III C-methyltransferase / precorrin-2 dehydrogenase / sirohydrochlorin ferrochelatase
MDYLPIFLRLEDSNAVVVGGGAVAARKAELLLRCGARVRLVAPELGRAAGELVAGGGSRIEHAAAEFAPQHLDGAALVIAAADSQVNASVARAARMRRLPVNVADDPALSSFILPAVVDRSPVIVAVGTEGHAPVLARRLRQQLEALLPARLGALARFAGVRRRSVQEALRPSERRPFWERIFAGAVSVRVLAGDERGADAEFARELSVSRAITSRRGEVYLIGAGPGDPDLLTLRALQLLQQADVVLYDRLVSEGVLERARREAQRVFVGKEPVGATGGAPDRNAQQRIHELMASYVERGLKVARLKGGDPFIFGRGGEEIEFLEQHGIPFSVVPGITAALAAGASAALPLTRRDLARSVTLATGHCADSEALDWQALARPRHTAVFYMSLSNLDEIVARLIAAGAPPDRPAAVIERASLPGERVLRGRLAEVALLARAERITSPAVLVVGEVAAARAHAAAAAHAEALRGVA